MLKIIYTFIFLTLVLSVTQEELTKQGILVIQPSALISMRNYFPRIVVFAHNPSNSQYLDGFIQ